MTYRFKLTFYQDIEAENEVEANEKMWKVHQDEKDKTIYSSQFPVLVGWFDEKPEII